MATAGTINIFVNAITKKFDDGISSVHKKIKSLTRGFADINGAVQVAERVFNLAVRAAEAFANEIERLDELVDTANRLNLSADSLQKFHRAAEIASGDVESMNKALATFQRILGDAAAGQSGAVKSFERIGLNAQALSEAGLDQAFTAVLAKLGQIPNAAERASIGADLFGKSAMNLTDLLENGSTAIQQATNDLNQFGVSLSSRADDIDRAKRSMEQLKMATSGLTTELTIAAAPLAAMVASGAATGISSLRHVQSSDVMQSVAGAGVLNPLGDVIGGVLARGFARSVTSQPFGSGALADHGAFTQRFGMDSPMLDAYMDRDRFRPMYPLGPQAPAGSGVNPFRQLVELRDMVGGSFGSDARTITARGAAGAEEFGSLGAFQAVQASQRQDEAAKLQKQELEETKKTNRILERVFEDALVISALDLQG